MDIFVKGLPLNINTEQLKELFGTYGRVLSSKVIIDHATNLSRGFGFVTMLVESEGNLAIRRLNGSDLEGNTLIVKPARPKNDTQSKFKSPYDSGLPKSFKPPKEFTQRRPFKDYD